AMGCASLGELEPFCVSDEARAALEELRFVLGRMAALGHGESVGLDLNIVRGLAYYTGLVFEVFDAAKSMRAIAGGGRYDDLCAKLGGEKVTGVGFGMGDVVLKDLLEEHGLLPDVSRDRLDYWLVSFDGDVERLFRTAEALRAKGRRVAHPLELRKFAKQMQEADRSGAAKVLMLGSDKAPEGSVEVKDLRDGSQGVVPLDQL
ncbi:MAG: ATP phosphoribosyltransferase regulatory subunit, partial [Fibrobacterales bacterium]|nr:ATP phosphoribosyltransferase regulatory subunit [Fibrobacterales bacterium]